MPSSLKIFIVASNNVNNQYADVCSALKESGHHVNVWEAINESDDIWESEKEKNELVKKYLIKEQNNDNKLVFDKDLSKATREASWADMLLLVGFGRDACFLAGVAHTSGVRTVVFDEFPFEWGNSLPAQSISYWRHTLEDVVELANNWEDPLPKRLEE